MKCYDCAGNVLRVGDKVRPVLGKFPPAPLGFLEKSYYSAGLAFPEEVAEVAAVSNSWLRIKGDQRSFVHTTEYFQKVEVIETSTFEHAKVGDRVYSPEFGFGVVSHIMKPSLVPLSVRFEGHTITFTSTGCRNGDQILFWDKPTAPVKRIVWDVVPATEPDSELRAALDKSVEKWEKIYIGEGTDQGGKNCALCEMCLSACPTDACSVCILSTRPELKMSCNDPDSVYYKWVQHHREVHNENHLTLLSKPNRTIQCGVCAEIVKEMIDGLKQFKEVLNA